MIDMNHVRRDWSVRDFIASQRRVEVAWERGREVMSVRIARADGTFRAVAATALELERYRGGPIEIFRFLVRDDSLDQAAISLLARDRIHDLTSRPDPGPFDGYQRSSVPAVADETLTLETLRRAVRDIDAALRSGTTSAREAAQAARGFTRVLEMAPAGRLREAMQEHTRQMEEAAFFGETSRAPARSSATEAELLARDFMRNLRRPVMPNPARRAVRGEIEEDAQVEKPEPLAPPNPALPFYRMER